MILYELICEHGHKHESWFRDSAAFDALAAAEGLTCPVCGSTHVTKALMTPRLGRRKGQLDPVPPEDLAQQGGEAESAPSTTTASGSVPSGVPSLGGDPKTAAMVREVLDQVRQKVEENCDYVGDQFAEEARRIHYGESESRGIYGEATQEETKALLDEGVEIMALPVRRTTS